MRSSTHHPAGLRTNRSLQFGPYCSCLPARRLRTKVPSCSDGLPSKSGRSGRYSQESLFAHVAPFMRSLIGLCHQVKCSGSGYVSCQNIGYKPLASDSYLAYTFGSGARSASRWRNLKSNALENLIPFAAFNQMSPPPFVVPCPKRSY